MKIINAKVYTEEGIFEKKDVYTDGELISGKSGDDEVLDAEGCYLIPGLTDIHFHGCVGHDFCDGTHESIEAMAMYEASQGITTIVPATMTLGEDTLQKICEAAASYRNEKVQLSAVSTWRDHSLPWQKKVPRMEISYTNRMQRCSEDLIKHPAAW